MKLADIKDSNGTSIQSYVDSLVEKVNEQEEMTVIVLIARQPDQLSLVHNIASELAVPDILSQIAAQMRKTPLSIASKNMTDRMGLDN